MKKSINHILTALIWLSCATAPLAAQDTMYVAHGDGSITKFPVVDIDSIYFQMPSDLPPALNVSTTSEGNNIYSLTAGDMTLEIDASAAGRVSSFKKSGTEFIAGSNVHSTNWGATFWASPQSLWDWPPPDEFDNDAGQITLEDDRIICELPTESAHTGLQFTKTFYFDQELQAFALELTMTNNGGSNVNAAPWLITRVPAKGITVSPISCDLIESAPFPYTFTENVLWLDYTGGSALPSGKLKADGQEGWAAHCFDDWAFIHHYPEVSRANIAPNEGDMEIYLPGSKSYIEIEPQGEYQAIANGSAVTWTVYWSVHSIPEGIPVESESTELLQWLRTKTW